MKSLDEYYQSYAKDLYAYLYSFCYDKQLCEEVVQETFYQAYMNIGELEAGYLKAWLFRTAYNKFIDYTRKSKRTQPQEIDFFANILKEPNFEIQLIKEESLKEVFKQVDSLPVNQKQALTLFAVHKLSYQEIAITLGITERSVKSLIFRARATLRKTTTLKGE